MTFTRPASDTIHALEGSIRAALADAELEAHDAAEIAAAARRLASNNNDLKRAIGDHTDPEMRGPGYAALLSYGVALRCIGRPDLIAALRIKAAETVERSIAHRLTTIAEKRGRALARQSWDAAGAEQLIAEATRLEASLTELQTKAAALRQRAADLLSVKVAA